MSSGDELTDEEAEAAKAKLTAAIREYREIMDPGCYVNAWALITENLSPELEREHVTMVSVLVPTGQSFVTTRGLVEVAADGERMR